MHHRTNDISSALLHLFGFVMAIGITVALVVMGARYGGPWHVAGYLFFGVSLILLYAASTAYHLIPHHYPRAKHLFLRLDHVMIYVFIAASYTPVIFVVLTAGWWWILFGVIWGLALIGVTIRILWLPIHPAFGVALYVLMGALSVVPLHQQMALITYWLMIAGGVVYIIGVLFFVLDGVLPKRKYFWMHEIFHVFVLGGSSLHALGMYSLLL